MTLRTLDGWRARDTPEVVALGRSLLDEASALSTELPAVRVLGPAVSAGGVLVLLEPADPGWEALSAALGIDAVGGAARPTLHATAVHFAAPIAHPAVLLEHIGALDLPPVEGQLPALELVRYDHESALPGMRARRIA
ncbi:hypothetical protein OVA14_09070 [Agrococcus sp. SL85]|uniref:hypothetical protein n=1 Tax=Agrococcus sp. SL85 TaxID=2995141 RepID=UPI00226CB9B3|nr:hypothetical protein [Agrococcus sp. SL85]WAC65505.1 hypothetical protein OVA14_09070 [Agrococcus sp. SL85]